MNLERIPEYLTVTIATTIGIGIAIFCGQWTGEGQFGMLLKLLGAIVLLVICLTMRTRLWMLIPMGLSLTGQIQTLEIPFAVYDLIVMFVTAVFMVFMALKLVRRKPSYGWLDVLLLANLLYLGSAFIRNPVGFEAFNSVRVGGKPYFNVFVATLAYWVLIRAHVTPTQARRLPLLIAGGGMINGLLSVITFNFPSTVPVISQFYSGISIETYEAELGPNPMYEETPTRHSYLSGIGGGIVQTSIAFFRPLTLVSPFHLLRSFTFLIGMVLIMASGFRSLVVCACLSFLLGSYFRTGWIDVIRGLVIAVPLVIILIVGQGRLYELPLAIQRALSFLPGKWDLTAVEAAHASTVWRVEMWKIVLTEEKYIQHKWLGDGFGFDRQEYDNMMRIQATGANAAGDQESAMIVGGIHSGPISAIRVVGVVGLAGYMLLLTLMAREAIRLIRQSSGSPFFPLGLFLGIPVIIEPLNYIFIFGGYEAGLPRTIFTLGMLRMLRNSLETELAREAQDLPVVVNSPANIKSTATRHSLRNTLASF